MAELKKRASIRMGFVLGMQDIDPVTDTVVNDHVVNVWGGMYERMEPEEAVLFQAELNNKCGADLDALITKARKVASDFGLETVIGSPASGGKNPPRGNAG